MTELSHSEKLPDMLTINQMSKLLNLSPWTIRRCAGKTLPPFVKLTPRLIRWRKVDVFNFLKGQNNVSDYPN